MKTTLVLAVVAAIVAVVCGVPGSHAAPKWNSKVVKTTFNSSNAHGIPTSDSVIDWARAGALAEDIRMIFTTSETTVATIAKRANYYHGSEIASIAYYYQHVIDSFMTRMQENIQEKTLNVEQVAFYLRNVTFAFVESASEIESWLIMLGKPVRDEIRSIFEEGMESANELMEELFDMFEIESRKKMF